MRFNNFKFITFMFLIGALALTLLATNVNAAESCQAACSDLTKYQEDCVVKRRCNPDFKKMAKKQRELEKKIEELEQENGDLRTEVALLEQELDLENQTISAHMNMAERRSHKKNSFNFLLGRTPTGLEVEQSSNSYEANTKPETDMGLMYQRDFGKKSLYRGSIGLTVRGSGYLGIGFNF